MGLPGLCGPLARYSEMIDGTYTLEDVLFMHSVLDEIVYQKEVKENAGK